MAETNDPHPNFCWGTQKEAQKIFFFDIILVLYTWQKPISKTHGAQALWLEALTKVKVGFFV